MSSGAEPGPADHRDLRPGTHGTGGRDPGDHQVSVRRAMFRPCPRIRAHRAPPPTGRRRWDGSHFRCPSSPSDTELKHTGMPGLGELASPLLAGLLTRPEPRTRPSSTSHLASRIGSVEARVMRSHLTITTPGGRAAQRDPPAAHQGARRRPARPVSRRPGSPAVGDRDRLLRARAEHRSWEGAARRTPAGLAQEIYAG